MHTYASAIQPIPEKKVNRLLEQTSTANRSIMGVNRSTIPLLSFFLAIPLCLAISSTHNTLYRVSLKTGYSGPLHQMPSTYNAQPKQKQTTSTLLIRFGASMKPNQSTMPSVWAQLWALHMWHLSFFITSDWLYAGNYAASHGHMWLLLSLRISH